MTENILFFTGNKGKVKEINNELSKHTDKHIIIMKDMDLPEIQSMSNKEVIKYKLDYVKQQMLNGDMETSSFIVEDTGLYIDNMNNFPGALIKFYLKSVGCEGISKFNGGSRANAETWIGYWDCKNNKEHYFVGRVSGFIADTPRGNNGFGYDPIFIPENLNEYDIHKHITSSLTIKDKNIGFKTFAEFNDFEKSACNMRTIACFQFANFIISKS